MEACTRIAHLQTSRESSIQSIARALSKGRPLSCRWTGLCYALGCDKSPGWQMRTGFRISSPEGSWSGRRRCTLSGIVYSTAKGIQCVGLELRLLVTITDPKCARLTLQERCKRCGYGQCRSEGEECFGRNNWLIW